MLLLYFLRISLILSTYILSDIDTIVAIQSMEGNVTCSVNEFSCTNNNRCIPRNWQCDNESDCNDGSDENSVSCANNVCENNEFRCLKNTGVCIPLTWLCDDNKDCPDGSDEANCNNITCRSNEYTCKNGNCIEKKWVCDADNDCGDGSDEQNCSNVTCNTKDSFQCDKSSCIPLSWRCDGELDCPGGQDEQNCTKDKWSNIRCESNEFSCNDRVYCIANKWLCDGKNDCLDDSDESETMCPHLHIVKSCHNSQCKNDSVEQGNRTCNLKTEFNCGDGHCIDISLVCNKKMDCPNGNDEPSHLCNVNECLINNGGCNQRCIDTPISYHCDCNHGYKLVNNHTCKDINECETFGSCSQVCINENGGFKCECMTGYLRDPRDVTKCKSIEGHISLLFTCRRDIRKISLDHYEMTSIVDNTTSATALDFVFKTGTIFWSDVHEKKIYKAAIDNGNDYTVVIDNDITTADGLAVDWIYNHIYWTDASQNIIEVADFDGKMRKVLIDDQLEEPRSLAVNPLEGWMFWTDWGSKPKIERAGMDGTLRQVIVNYDIKWPNGLTLDLVKRALYWVDAKLSTISACDYNGDNRRVILKSVDFSSLKHPFSITTFEDWIYWTDWDKAAIYKANKFTGKNVEAVTATELIRSPMVIHVYHPFRQPDGNNFCQLSQEKCSHFCLASPSLHSTSSNRSCACPVNMIMQNDGLTCTVNVTKVHKNDTLLHVPAIELQPTIESNVTVPMDAQQHVTVPIIVITLLLIPIGVIMGIAIYIIYRKYLKRNITSMNFDNPVYRKTTEDNFSLENNQFHLSRHYIDIAEEEAQLPLTDPTVNVEIQ